MAKLTVIVFAFLAFSLLSETIGYKTNKDEHHKCPKNEVWLNCGRPCQTECHTLGHKCNNINHKCKGGCYCKPGWARITPGGKCVPQDECPKHCCPKNEVWLECGQAPACEKCCGKVKELCNHKSEKCPKGCYCKKGYVRDFKTKKCIPIKDCKGYDKNDSESKSDSN